MFDNFLEESYHPWDKIYTNFETGNCLYLGDVQSALDIEFLQTHNIKTVVTAAKDMDHISYEDAIFHVVYPLLDGKHEDITAFFDSFYQIVQNNITKGSILIHCAAGISRSSTLVISYLMKRERMTFRDAIAFVRKSRPSVLPNLGFERQLKKYEEGLKTSSKHSRSSQRQQIRSSSSGNTKLVIRQQLPILNINKKMHGKFMNFNIKNLIDKITQKDMQVLKIYNKRNQSKNKKFIISKKSASFTKHNDDMINKPALIQQIEQSKFSARILGQNRVVKTPMQQMKEVYLTKKNNIQLEKRFPTSRGNTFYNMHKIKPEEI